VTSVLAAGEREGRRGAPFMGAGDHQGAQTAPGSGLRWCLASVVATHSRRERGPRRLPAKSSVHPSPMRATACWHAPGT